MEDFLELAWRARSELMHGGNGGAAAMAAMAAMTNLDALNFDNYVTVRGFRVGTTLTKTLCGVDSSPSFWKRKLTQRPKRKDSPREQSNPRRAGKSLCGKLFTDVGEDL